MRSEQKSAVEKMLLNSGVCHALQNLLSDYILLEDYFMTENIKKAMSAASSDTPEPDQLSSPMLDDVFFLLKKCVGRAISGQNVDGVCAVVNNAVGILEQDFCGLLQGQLKLGFPSGYLDLTQAYNVIQSSFQQGKLQGGDMEKQKMVFLVSGMTTYSEMNVPYRT